MSKNIQNIQNQIKAKFGFENKFLQEDLEDPFFTTVVIFRDNRFELLFNLSTHKLELKTIYSNQEVDSQFIDDLNWLFEQIKNFKK